MMRDLKDQIRTLAREFDADDAAAYDLWTWLPSYEFAGKCRGDYAIECQPSKAAIMEEAAEVISALKQGKPMPKCETCPCGEFCEEGE